jgi:hypothetical protein
MGSLYWPYRETGMSDFGHYLWWAFCIKTATAIIINKQNMDGTNFLLSFIYSVVFLCFSLWFFISIIKVLKKGIKISGEGLRKKLELPYRIKEGLMTKAEKNFFDVLEKTVDNRYYIVPQVNLASLVFVSGTKYFKTFLNKIDRKTVDFVLFNRQFTPVVVIELDDSSHDEISRRRRDDFVDRVMSRVGLKIVHIKTAYTYDPEEINKLILL